MATIRVFEQESPYDEYDTENGVGHADDVEPYEIGSVTVLNDDDDINAALEDLGFTQWDGGNVAYDPDGSHMAPDGTITTRWAEINR